MPTIVDKAIFVTGHRGMVGSAIVRQLQKRGYGNILTASHQELDLTRQDEVSAFFQKHKIDEIYMAAAKVGGIHANNVYPAEFIYQNLMIEANVIHAAHCSDVNDIFFLASSCIYPCSTEQPMREDALLTDVLEPTNEPYAIAKIAGIKLCESYNRQYGHNYRSVTPANLYGPNDSFHSENSHAVAALLRRFHEAVTEGRREVVIWGSGKSMREFLHVDDLAAASIFVMEIDAEVYQANIQPMISHINVGSGIDYTVKKLAEMIAEITGFDGQLIFDDSKPDGMPRKLVDMSRLKALGWQPSIPLEDGLRQTYQWYLSKLDSIRFN